MRNLIIPLLTAALLACDARAAGFQQQPAVRQPAPQAAAVRTDSRADKVWLDVQKIGVTNHITVELKGGEKRHGTVTRIDDGAFQIFEVDLNQPMAFAYTEVKKVRAGYGEKSLSGRRVDPHTSHIVGVLGAVGIIVVAILCVPKT